MTSEIEETKPYAVHNTDDRKWYGVPPKGQRPTPSKWRYVAEILCVILFEFVVWGIYRSVSAPFISPFGSMKFYIAHIIAAPIIHLIPIMLYWRFIRKERGHPFTFTRTRIMSGVTIGLVSAVIWRVLEMLSDDLFISAAGGRVFGTMGFYSHLDTTTVLLFAIMTFVHFCIVGPVEELEFRGFTHDQAARVLTNWQALIFSSVLFGLSHVPIAITVYKMPLHQLIVAEIGWMSAGAVFGALYMWSRNIWACIIMHGMGNWQLSVFNLSGRATAEGMSTMTSVFVGTLTSVIVNAIMIGIFYLIFRYYWEPQRRAEAAGRIKRTSVWDRIRAHDYGRRPIGNTSVKLTVFCVAVCAMIMLATFTVGETDHSKRAPVFPYSGQEGPDLSSFVESDETEIGGGTLTEGNSEVLTLECTEGSYIAAVEVTMSWTDEPDMRQGRYYENQPDTFMLRISGPNVTDSDQGANPRNGEGSLSAGIALTKDEMSELLTEEDNYTVTVEITLAEAGNYEARVGLGVVQLVDDSNDYSYEMTVTWLEAAE